MKCSDHNSNETHTNLNVKPNRRKNSIFDYIDETDFNDLNPDLNYSATSSSAMHKSDSVPTIQISFYQDNDINCSENENNSTILNEIQMDIEEDKVDENMLIGAASSSNTSHKKIRPRSLRFNFANNSLMNQNVDENEEYDEQLSNNKDFKPKIINSDLNKILTKKINNITHKSEFCETLKADNSETNNAKQIYSSKSDSSEQSNPIAKSASSNARDGQQHITQQSTKSEFLSPAKAKKHKYIKKSLNPKLVKNEIIQQPKELFIELEQLNLIDSTENSYEWSEVSRWIKYEQNLTLDSSIWSKPFVGALIYQSLLYLKTGLQYGTVLLSSDHESLDFLMDEIIQDFIDSGHMNKENKEQIKRVLLSPHRHNHSMSASGSKKSTMSDLFNANQSGNNSRRTSANEPENSTTGNISRKNSFINLSDHKFRKSVKLSNSEIELDNKIQNLNDNKHQATSNVINQDEHSNENNIHFNSIHKNRRSTIALIRSTLGHSRAHNRHESSFKGISPEAEAFAVMVGVVEFLDRPVMAFVRLSTSITIDEMVEVNLKIRFVFILLGPKNDNIDYLEIGRCIGTLMQNKEFRECAYRANDRRELIDSITNFMNRSLCLVLPVGNFDDDLIAPLIEWMQNKLKKKKDKLSTSDLKIYDRRQSTVSKSNLTCNIKKNIDTQIVEEQPIETDEIQDHDPFQRTGYPFGCLINEIRYRYSCYLSDFRDALNLHCLVAFVFTFTVCIAPALSFGGILADKTDKWFGVNEMLIATSINGIIAGFFSGQPLMIYGETGPFLVFEEMLFYKFCIEYLAVRCWVALWILAFCLLMLACEGVYIINYVTRFAEEIFAFLIACVFLTDAFKKMIRTFYIDPVYTAEKYCSLRFKYNPSLINQTVNKTEENCWIYKDEFADEESNHIPNPNIALLSLILLIGTCVIALALKKLRRSVFFGAYVRRTLSDVGILISIILMVFVDYIIQSKTGVITQKLDIPDGLVPTKYRNSWLVSPLGNNFDGAKSPTNNKLPIWVPFVAIFPAFLIFIVLFFEVEVTQLILYAKHRKLKKGSGFSLDLLIAALLITLNSFFGLPWMCAAPVRTLAHWASLTVYSTTYVPGEKPKLMSVKEQRLTNICVHLAIGLCLLAKTALKMIPISVLFGIFLYFGIVSLSGTQLYERIKLIFIPPKYCPNVVYARGVRPSKRNLFTIIQLISVILMLLMKSFKRLSFIFPVFLVLLVPFRTFVLPRLFTPKELEQLDHDKDDQDTESETALDFYELAHLPI